jgi:hypothetical protein
MTIEIKSFIIKSITTKIRSGNGLPLFPKILPLWRNTIPTHFSNFDARFCMEKKSVEGST